MSGYANLSSFVSSVGAPKQAPVTVAEKPELMAERIVIYFFPIVTYECCDKQQQGTLRLVKISDQAVHYPETVTRRYQYTRSGD